MTGPVRIQRKRDKLPSQAQARKLAWLWGIERKLTVYSQYADPTEAVLVSRGWVEPTGERTERATLYAISSAGFYALEGYLQDRRFKGLVP